jgi:hypothetical protein
VKLMHQSPYSSENSTSFSIEFFFSQFKNQNLF